MMPVLLSEKGLASCILGKCLLLGRVLCPCYFPSHSLVCFGRLVLVHTSRVDSQTSSLCPSPNQFANAAVVQESSSNLFCDIKCSCKIRNLLLWVCDIPEGQRILGDSGPLVHFVYWFLMQKINKLSPKHTTEPSSSLLSENSLMSGNIQFSLVHLHTV